MRHFFASALIALLSTVGVSAQERTVRKVEASSGRREIHKLSVVMKSNILIREDEPAGRVVDVILSDGGCVEYLVAEHESKYYVLPYQAADVRYTDQVVFVDIAPAQFRQVQFFSQDRWPDVYATEFRQQVNTAFNVRVDAAGEGRNRPRDNDRDPGRNADRNNRDPKNLAPDSDRSAGGQERPGARKPAPDAPDRSPRGEERPGAGNRDGKPAPKPEPKGTERDPSAAPKPEAKGSERDPAPRGEAPGTSPKPAPKEKDTDRDEKDEDKKPKNPPKPAPNP